jgi:uridine kinase
MKSLFLNPFFSVGVVIRALLFGVAIQPAALNWYVPFLVFSVTGVYLDPWEAFVGAGGGQESFPYGYAMWVFFLPGMLVCKAFEFQPLLGYVVSLFVADLLLLLVLRKLLPNFKDYVLLIAYWLSPIVLVATYGFGYNDLVPVLLLCLALVMIRQSRFLVAGLLSVAAVSAKLSMVLAVPFFCIYLIRNKSVRHFLRRYISGLALGAPVLLVQWMVAPSSVAMLFGNPEFKKAFQFALVAPSGESIYLLPLAYMVVLYAAWGVRRLSFELLNSILGVAFLLVVLLTPAPHGWFIWSLPLLVQYQLTIGRMAFAQVGIFSGLFLLHGLMGGQILEVKIANSYLSGLIPLDAFGGAFFAHAQSLVHTAIFAIGMVLVVSIWRRSVKSNDYFRLSRKPFVIGVSGDSGSGKDTLVDSLVGLFGNHSVAKLSGDDYHIWDRHKPMWQVMTHLNPMANDLERFSADIMSLVAGKSVHVRHYDHVTGKMSLPATVKSNDFILVSGLHTLYLPVLRECYDLKIFLDIDEGLRRYFKLQRDVVIRGHSIEHVERTMARREPDSARFIRPQEHHADLVLSLQPIHPSQLLNVAHQEAPRTKLFVRSKSRLHEAELVRILVGVCGLHVDMNIGKDASEVELTIEGEVSAEDVALSASILYPRVLDFLDVIPKWQHGMLGLMQLIVLAHLHQELNKRLM